MNHYETLGIAKDADEAEIKAAWRRKSSAAHPDREGGSDELQASINKAYEVLGDAERRANYDASGDDDLLPPLDVKAREAMVVVFMACVEAAPEHLNLIAEADRMLIRHRGDHQTIVNDCRSGLADLKKRKARVNMKKSGTNFLVAAIDQRMTGLLELQGKNQEQLAIIDRARELLKDYEYEMPTPAQVFTAWETGPKTIGHIAAKWPDGS